jgi:hypothetical protein
VLLTTLTFGDQKATCHSIVDSGADCCLFPLYLLRKLRLNAENMPLEHSSGVGDARVPMRFAHLTIEIPGFARFPARVGFTAGLDAWSLGVLGQIGFFENFRVFFDYSAGYFNIETK